MASITAMAREDIEILENSLVSLSNNMSSVANDVVVINGQIEDFHGQVSGIKETVKTLEEEIRNFMVELKNSTNVSNAQNSILLKEQELNKKYGYYDEIRRKTIGLFDGIDIDTIDKNTLISQKEHVVLNAPNYYLSYALVAICSWFNNDKDSAYKSLNKALQIDQGKTSLLLCLINIKIKRNDSALKWIKNYLSVQEPNKVDHNVIYMLDSLSNNIFDNKMTSLVIDYFNNWINKLDYFNSDIENKKLNNLLEDSVKKTEKKDYPYLFQYSSDYENIIDILAKTYAYYNIYNKILEIINDSKTGVKSYSELLNSLLFSDDINEFLLRKDIYKNKLIVSNNGDNAKVEKEFDKSSLSLNSSSDFYTLLNYVFFEKNDISSSSKKLALAYLKNSFIRTINNFGNNKIKNIKISINGWVGNTTDGSNEKELQKNFINYTKKKYYDNNNRNNMNIMKLIVCSIFFVFGIGFCFFKWLLGLPIVVIAIIIGIYFILEQNNKNQILEKTLNNEIKNNLFELNNILAEIVDIKFIVKHNEENAVELIKFLNTYEKINFISSVRK